MQTNEDLAVLLARIDENLKNFRSEYRSDKEEADASRRRLHERMDGQAHEMMRLENTLEVTTLTVAHQSELVKSLKGRVEPTLEQINDLKKAGKLVSIILLALGITGTSMLVYARDFLGSIIKRLF